MLDSAPETPAAPFDPAFFQQPHWLFLVAPAVAPAVAPDSKRILRLNNSSFLGYAPNHFHDLSALLALVHPADQAQASELFAGRQPNAGFRLQTPAGAWTWLHGRSFWFEQPEQANSPVSPPLAVVLRLVQEHIPASPRSQQAEAALLEQVQQARAVARFLEQMNAGATLDEVLSKACAEIVRALGIPYTVVSLYHPAQDALVVAAYNTSNPDDPGITHYQPIPRAAFDVLRQQMGDVIVIPDAQQLPGMVADEVKASLDVRTLVITPIELEEELLGVLILVSVDEQRRFSEQELVLVKIYTSQIAEALGRARLLNLAQRQASQLELLNHIARVALESSNLKDMLDNLAQYITERLRAEGCMLLLWDEARNQIIPFSGFGNNVRVFMAMTYQQADLAWSQSILQSGQIGYYEHIEQYISENLLRQMPEGSQIPSAVMAIPLRIQQRQLGVLFAGFQKPHPFFSTEDLSGWQEVANQLSLAIEKQQLLEQERQRRAEAETLQRATAALAGPLDLAQVFDNTLTCLAQVVPVDSATVTIIEEDGLRMVAARGLPSWYLEEYLGKLLPPSFGMFALLEDTYAPVVLNEAGDTFERLESVRPHGLRPGSWMGTTLVAFGNRIGYLTIGNWQPHAFRPADSQHLQAFAQQAAIALANARLFEEVQQGHEALERLSQRLVEVQEDERRTLARELHDEIGQVLTGLAYTIEMGRRMEGPAHQQALLEAQDLLATLTRQVREISLNLRPSVLDDLGLQAACEWLFNRFQQQTGLQIKFFHNHLPPTLDNRIAITAFRLVQEAITNAARHARVNELSVWLSVENGELFIQVEDRGTGFDPQRTSQHYQSSGLTGMAERVRLVGGRFQVLSEPGHGTQVTAVLPLA